jgi:environmental stress-induced protein Ves
MIEQYNIRSICEERSAQSSFHMAAEQHVRIEFRNLVAGQAVGPFTYDGDIVVSCYRGCFRIEAADIVQKLGELDQAVIPVRTNFKLICESTGTVQFIWTPAHARTIQG